jgi:hypothetical protein
MVIDNMPIPIHILSRLPMVRRQLVGGKIILKEYTMKHGRVHYIRRMGRPCAVPVPMKKSGKGLLSFLGLGLSKKTASRDSSDIILSALANHRPKLKGRARKL